MSYAVEKSSPSNIPKDAVILSKAEAVDYQLKTIYEWKPSSEVWPFRYGIALLSGSGAISSLVIATHFRRKLKLLHHGRVAMLIPTVLLPSFLLPITHMKTACPVCIQMRAVMTQSIMGIVYPMMITPITSFMYASMFATYNLPPFSKENLGELLQTFYKIARPLSSKLAIIFAFQVGMAVTITNMEAQSYFKIQKKLRDNYKTEEELPS